MGSRWIKSVGDPEVYVFAGSGRQIGRVNGIVHKSGYLCHAFDPNYAFHGEIGSVGREPGEIIWRRC